MDRPYTLNNERMLVSVPIEALSTALQTRQRAPRRRPQPRQSGELLLTAEPYRQAEAPTPSVVELYRLPQDPARAILDSGMYSNLINNYRRMHLENPIPLSDSTRISPGQAVRRIMDDATVVRRSPPLEGTLTEDFRPAWR